MPVILEMLVTVLCAVCTSAGIWHFIEHRANRKDARNDMLKGLAHDRIMYLGTKYVERGIITPDEYENLNDYLFVPYTELGGNGSAAKIMAEVGKLPMVPSTYKHGTD